MSNSKVIQEKINSINSTQKITKAMHMVAASKMKKAEDNMLISRPYSLKMTQVINHIANSNTEYSHPYIEKNNSNDVGIVVISTNRGLCGGLNQNLFRKVLHDIQEYRANNKKVHLFLVGNKANSFFKNINVNIAASIDGFEKFMPQDVLTVSKLFSSYYKEEKIGSLFIAYNKFENTMSQMPVISSLLPLKILESDEKLSSRHWDYIYEMSSRDILNELLERYVQSVISQSVVENIASEQAARMVAMQNATSNADEIKEKLKLSYNKLRQASITQELAEIVSGASAIN
jgi:F-type H+-transporting ATPase subunit gamma